MYTYMWNFIYTYNFLEENTKHVLDLVGAHYLMFLSFRKW